MDVVASSSQERSEVDAVLQSGIFEKAPRLEKFFLYICRLHFEGRADEIKEYSIALEALGRSSEFDPKKDSIVRVEAHRLRKRLAEDYRGVGANDTVQIVIPNGQYRPQFVLQNRIEHTEILVPAGILVVSEPDPLTTTGPTFVPRTHRRLPSSAWNRSWPWLVVVAVLASVSPLALSGRAGFPKRGLLPGTQNERWSGPSSEPVSEEFRILTGYHGSAFVDRQGHTWGADAYFTGGTSKPISTERFIEGQPDPHLLQTHRSGQFQYDIPLRQGAHEL